MGICFDSKEITLIFVIIGNIFHYLKTILLILASCSFEFINLLI